MAVWRIALYRYNPPIDKCLSTHKIYQLQTFSQRPFVLWGSAVNAGSRPCSASRGTPERPWAACRASPREPRVSSADARHVGARAPTWERVSSPTRAAGLLCRRASPREPRVQRVPRGSSAVARAAGARARVPRGSSADARLQRRRAIQALTADPKVQTPLVRTPVTRRF